MFTKFSLSLITIILLMSLAGCGTINQPTPSSSEASSASQSSATGSISDTSTEENYQMLPIITGNVATLKLDASADGTTQQLKKGEVMSVALESNASTGYAWTATITNTAVLVQMGEPEYSEPSSSSTPLVGAPGTQTFYFQAAETGSATITLAYARSFETGVAPLQTISITVDVK
jgi:predicted secreted protein